MCRMTVIRLIEGNSQSSQHSHSFFVPHFPLLPRGLPGRPQIINSNPFLQIRTCYLCPCHYYILTEYSLTIQLVLDSQDHDEETHMYNTLDNQSDPSPAVPDIADESARLRQDSGYGSDILEHNSTLAPIYG